MTIVQEFRLELLSDLQRWRAGAWERSTDHIRPPEERAAWRRLGDRIDRTIGEFIEPGSEYGRERCEGATRSWSEPA